VALDSNIAALLTTSVTWTPKTGVDKNNRDTYGTPVVLKCYPAYGARMLQKRDGTVYASAQTLYFDASDSHVQSFQLGDKFTSVGIAGGQTLEAQEIASVTSPGPSIGAPVAAWLVEVYL
jgi:hypothetical protein